MWSSLLQSWLLTLSIENSVTHWGTSPKFLTALRQHGLPANVDVECLQHVMSAGSPLGAELHHWFAAKFPKGVGVFSASGGTDLVGGSKSPFSDQVSPRSVQITSLLLSRVWNSNNEHIPRRNRRTESRHEGGNLG